MAIPVGFRHFKMNWKVKTLLVWAFDVLPKGNSLYFQVQKHVTKTVPRKMSPTSTSAAAFLENWAALVAHFDGQDIATKQFFEFGAGWDLFSNMVFWTLGANHQLVYDLSRWARPDQINLVIRHLRTDPPPRSVRLPVEENLVDAQAWQQDLKAKYGIDYRAPADASKTGLAERSVDAVVTTSVLEHLPLPEAEAIMRNAAALSALMGS